MRRLLLTISSAFVVVLLAVACTERQAAPTAPEIAAKLSASAASGTCTVSLADLTSLVQQVFGSGQPNLNSALGKLNNIQKKLNDGDAAGAQTHAVSLINFLEDKASQLVGRQYIPQLIAALECYVGLTTRSYLIFPDDQTQILKTSDGAGGVKLESNPVSSPTLLTLRMLPSSGPAPLTTQLDQYPGYLDITDSATVANPLLPGKATVAVCPTTTIPSDIRARLRLGHQASFGFEITPQADGSFLDCTGVTLAAAGASRAPEWLRRLASLVLPRVAYARQFDMISGGVGGTATEFSPFAPVDATLEFSGGVGGTATEFQRAPDADVPEAAVKKPGASMGMQGAPSSGEPGSGAAVKGGTSQRVETATAVVDCSVATVGSAVRPECRPRVELRTARGTVMRGVPVTFAVMQGGGATAVDDPRTRTCGAFGTRVTAYTSDNTGAAGACWTVGQEEGLNRLVATPQSGGDAPAGVTFLPSSYTSEVTASRLTPSVGATGGTYAFDSTAHPVIATCSNGLTPTVAYAGGSVPLNVGSHEATVTCGGDNYLFNAVTATTTITITALKPAVNVSCPASITYTGAALTPACTVTVIALDRAVDGATINTAYSNNTNAGEATVIATVAAFGNYALSADTTTFAIAQAPTTTTVSCPAVTYTGASLTPCTSLTTGAGGLSDTTAAKTYASNTNAGPATVSATYAGGGNWLGSTSGSVEFTIAKAPTSTVLSCPASVTYSGSAQTPCTSLTTGAGALSDATAAKTYDSNTNAGTATVIAAFAEGGNYLGSADTATFAITKLATSVTLSCLATVAYTGLAQTPCTATVAGADASAVPGAASITYSNNVTAGTAAASATYAGGANWEGSLATAEFFITKLAATATSGSATIDFGAVVPAIPCTVAALLPTESGAVTCTSLVPAITAAAIYPVVPVLSPTDPPNYAVTKYNGALTVLGYTQVGCFASPIYSSMPDSKSAQRKGSNLPVKCKLVNSKGVAVTTANGTLTIEDRGTIAAAAAGTVDANPLTIVNAFSYSSNGVYQYGLDTSPAKFVAGHYYYVTAKWKDGSLTTGWFLLK